MFKGGTMSCVDEDMFKGGKTRSTEEEAMPTDDDVEIANSLIPKWAPRLHKKSHMYYDWTLLEWVRHYRRWTEEDDWAKWEHAEVAKKELKRKGGPSTQDQGPPPTRARAEGTPEGMVTLHESDYNEFLEWRQSRSSAVGSPAKTQTTTGLFSGAMDPDGGHGLFARPIGGYSYEKPAEEERAKIQAKYGHYGAAPAATGASSSSDAPMAPIAPGEQAMSQFNLK